MRLVVKYTKWWIDQQIQGLKGRNIPLTYNLMGIMESYSSNNDETTQNAEPPKSISSRKRKERAEGSAKTKGKKIVNEGDVGKKQRSSQVHSSISASSRDLNNISILEDEPLGEVEIPPLIREERNVESMQQEV